MDAREDMAKKGIGGGRDEERPNTLEEKAWARAREAGDHRPRAGTPHDWEDWERHHDELAEGVERSIRRSITRLTGRSRRGSQSPPGSRRRRVARDGCQPGAGSSLGAAGVHDLGGVAAAAGRWAVPRREQAPDGQCAADPAWLAPRRGACAALVAACQGPASLLIPLYHLLSLLTFSRFLVSRPGRPKSRPAVVFAASAEVSVRGALSWRSESGCFPDVRFASFMIVFESRAACLSGRYFRHEYASVNVFSGYFATKVA